MRSLLFLSAILFSGNTLALTIDFEGPIVGLDPDPESSNYPTRLLTQGFEFETSDSAGWLYGGSASYCPWCAATMTAISGDSFDLVSADVVSVWPYFGPDSISVVGFYAGGGQINTVLNLDSDSTNFAFGAGWTGLLAVEFGLSSIDNAITLDNIVVSYVPVPAAVWLFGSALAGLGFVKRRKA
ncbi:MAG: VPLPA-CTERM sorting domain-containing protein [Gammaproteobacteria bacterium]